MLEAVNDENLMEDLENALAGADELLDAPDEEEVAEVGGVLGYCLPMSRDAPDLWKYFCRITGIIQDFFWHEKIGKLKVNKKKYVNIFQFSLKFTYIYPYLSLHFLHCM